MALKRFKTQGRIWAWISLTLFLLFWCIPMVSIKGGPTVPPGAFLLELLVALVAHPTDITEEWFLVLGFWAMWFAVPAVVLGWVVQAIIVMVRARKARS